MLKRLSIKILTLIFLLFYIPGCSSVNKTDNETWLNNTNIIFDDEQVDYIRETIVPLNLNSASDNSEEVLNYFRFYEIDFNIDAHYFGYYYSSEKKIAAHVYLNNDSKGTVLLLHGFLDHSANTFTKLIPELLNEGYTVAAIDLPGHGFSEGRRGDCKDFNEYYLLIKDFYNNYLHMLPGPYHILGHSTGCVGIFEALYDASINFETYILAAPLIRTDAWALSKFGMVLFGWFLPRVPGLTKRGTTNLAYAWFIAKEDPLFVRWPPTSWVRTLFYWEKDIRDYGTNNREIIILQGQKDRGLEWEYNIEYFKNRFDNCIIKYFPNANHTLFAEPELIRNEVIDAVLYYLNN